MAWGIILPMAVAGESRDRNRQDDETRFREWYHEENNGQLMTAAELRTEQRLNRNAANVPPRMTRPIARNRHDRVTIVIDETTSSSMQSKTDGKSSSDVNMGVESWFTLGSGGATSRGGDGKLRLPLSASSSRNHKGDAKSQDTQTFKTELSGRVLDVLPNGHLVIEAQKTQTVNKDTRTVLVTGVVDPANLDANSRVDAKFVMDVKWQMLSKGDIANDNRRGFLLRFYDRIKPL